MRPGFASSDDSFFASALRVSKRDTPSNAALTETIADMAHPPTAPAVSRAAAMTRTFLRCAISILMRVFRFPLRRCGRSSSPAASAGGERPGRLQANRATAKEARELNERMSPSYQLTLELNAGLPVPPPR